MQEILPQSVQVEFHRQVKLTFQTLGSAFDHRHSVRPSLMCWTSYGLLWNLDLSGAEQPEIQRPEATLWFGVNDRLPVACCMFDLQFRCAPLCLGYAHIIGVTQYFVILCTFVLQEVVEETAASNGLDDPSFLVCAGPRDANPWCMTYRGIWYIYIYVTHMNNEKSPGCLGYIGDYTTQLCGYENEPL